jgi:succinoglycan biosynthesis protein ExoV
MLCFLVGVSFPITFWFLVERFVAIYYFKDYSNKNYSRNFGDDINPFILSKLFDASLIESNTICIMGIGTILNDNHISYVEGYKEKIVFSSGAGYGKLTNRFDESWRFSCVRGPGTAAKLNLPESAGICDGAILLSRILPKSSYNRAGPVVFIPHVESYWKAHEGLERACKNLGFQLLIPDADPKTFINVVQSASLVITEAMHGAILSDTLRVPWIPVAFHFHNEFKWRDWFSSIDLQYEINYIKPIFWSPKDSISSILKKPYQAGKYRLFESSLSKIFKNAPRMLSAEGRIDELSSRLLEKVEEINLSYT